MSSPILLDPSLTWRAVGDGRSPLESAASAEGKSANAPDAAWQNAFAQARSTAQSPQVPLVPLGVLLQHAGERNSMLRPLAQPYASPSSAPLLSGSQSSPGGETDSSATALPAQSGGGASAGSRGATSDASALDKSNAPPADAASDAVTPSLSAPQGVPPFDASFEMQSAVAALAQAMGRALSLSVLPVDTPSQIDASLAASATPANQNPSRKDSDGDAVSEVVSDFSQTSPSSSTNSSNAAPEPTRLYAEWSSQGVSLWLGTDAATADTAVALAGALRRWMAGRGERLQSLVCNGQTVFQAQPDETSSLGASAPMSAVISPDSERFLSLLSQHFPKETS